MNSAIASPVSNRHRAHPSATRQGPVCEIQPCRFCDFAAGDVDLFGELYGRSPVVAVPGVPASHSVLMDSFPIGHAGGHVLVVPNIHVRSLAMVPSQIALRDAVRAVTTLLESAFPEYWLFAFEHGPGEIAHQSIACGGCHVDHAHGHILLLPRDVAFDDIRDLTEAALDEIGWDVTAQTNESRTPLVGIRRLVGHNPYLHIGMFAGPTSIAITYKQRLAEQTIPSQLLRRLVATAVGHPEPSYWNWKIALAARLTDRIQQYGRDALGFQAAVHGLIA